MHNVKGVISNRPNLEWPWVS